MSGSLYPGLTVGMLLSVVVLLVAVSYERRLTPTSMKLCLVGIVVLSVIYRLYIFQFPASLIGLDPFGYRIEILRVMNTGHTNAIDWFFYQNAPLSIVYPVISGLLAGLSARNAMSIYPLFIGIVIPLSIVLLTMRVASRNRLQKGAIAAILAAVALASVQFAYQPIAQSLAVAYWCVFLTLLTRYYGERSKRAYLLAGILLTALSFTHKLPLLVIVGTLFALLSLTGFQTIWKRIRRNLDTDRPRTQPYGVLFTLLTGMFLLIQWSYLTDFLTSVVNIGLAILTSEPSVSPPLTDFTPTAAVPVASGPVGILARRGHALVLVPLAGVAWLYVFFTQRDRSTAKILLTSAVISMGLLVLVIANPGESSSAGGPTNPARLIFFAEPVLVPLVAAVFGVGSLRSFLGRFPYRRLAVALSTILLIVVLVSQVYSALAVPDFQNSPREYLTESEYTGKAFGYQYIDDPVYTDWYSFAAETGPIRSVGPYQPVDKALLNATLAQNSSYGYFAYRTHADVFLTGVGPWRLTWDPERRLPKTYDRIYANDGFSVYKRSPVANRTNA